MNKISVVIPVYNGQMLLKQTLDSVFCQEIQELEVIVVDDGSTDDTYKVLEAYAQKEPRLSFVHVTNGGPSRARNEGIRRASGEYLFLCDADDLLEPGMLIKLAAALDKGADLAACGYWEDKVKDGRVTASRLFSSESFSCQSSKDFLGKLPDLMEKRLMYVTWNKLYRLDIVREQKLHFPDYASCEDRLFNLSYYAHVERFTLLGEPLFHYMVRDGAGLASRFLPNKYESLEAFDSKLRGLYGDAGLLDASRKESSARIFLKGAVACLISLYHPSCALDGGGKRAFCALMLHSASMDQALNEAPGRGSLGLVKLFLKPKSKALALFFGWAAAAAGTWLPGLMGMLKYRKS